jgi:hypothetical protein
MAGNQSRGRRATANTADTHHSPVIEKERPDRSLASRLLPLR